MSDVIININRRPTRRIAAQEQTGGPVRRRRPEELGRRRKKSGGRVIFYDLGNTADGLGGWDEHVINSANTSAVLTALNAVLTTPAEDWQTTFRPLSQAPNKNNLRVAIDSSEADKFVTTGETSWSGEISRETITIIDETPELALDPVSGLPFYNLQTGLFVHPSIGPAGGNYKVTATPDIDAAHTEFSFTDISQPVHIYLQRAVFNATGNKLVSDVSPTLSPSGPTPGSWSPEPSLHWWPSGICGDGLDYIAGSQSFSITGAGEKIEENISGNYISWNRGEVFTDGTAFNYNPADPYGFYFDVLNYTIAELVADYNYIPIRRTENWNLGGTGLWIEIFGGSPSSVLCLYPTGGQVILLPGPPGTAGIYYASGGGAPDIEEDPISEIELEVGDSGNATPASIPDSLLMAINQGDEWYYVWNRYNGGGG